MRRIISFIFLSILSAAMCFGQSTDKTTIGLTSVKDLVNNQRAGMYTSYTIKAHFLKTHSVSDLIILVEDEDYIIPVQLVKDDLGAEKRFLALNLQEGDELVIRGRLTRIDVGRESYKGLEDAIILNVGAVNEDNLYESEGKTYQLVEVKPSFMGGDASVFSMWVNNHLVYPEIAKANGVQGCVRVSFTIKTDGSVTNVRVLHGVDESLDKEAVRVISSSPKWTPGRSKGEPVDVTYTFPVYFMLH